MKLYDVLDKLEKEATPGPWYRMFSGAHDVSADDEEGTFAVAMLDGKYPEIGPNRDLIELSRNHLRKLLDLWASVKGYDNNGDLLPNGVIRALDALDIEVED